MDALNRWMFRPVSPRRLGVARALFYFWYSVQMIYYTPGAWVSVPASLWQPVPLLSFILPFTVAYAPQVGVVLLALLLGAVLGLGTRFSTIGVAVLGTALFGLTCCLGSADFHHYPLVLISWILPWSRCGQAFSLDAWLRHSNLAESGAYRWPLRLTHLCLLLPMASAGVHKALGSWLSRPAETMEFFIRFKQVVHARLKHDIPLEITSWPLEYPLLLTLAAYLTVFLELGCPMALFDKPAWMKRLWVGGLFALQLTLATCFLTLGSFPWLAAYFFWIPWEKLWKTTELSKTDKSS